MLQSEDKQVSLTDPDARSMATSGQDTGIVGYNVQMAVDTKNHIIVAHDVTNVGTDYHHLLNMGEQARTAMGVETIEVVADRGYDEGYEILACEEAGIYRNGPEATDFHRQGRRSLWQARLRLCGSGRCVYLPGG